jgi:hypothetical protein
MNNKGRFMAHQRKLSLLVITIAALGLASCSSPTASPSTSPSPSVTPTSSPTDTSASGIRLAKNDLETEFLQVALASCELTKTKSLGLYSSDENGSTMTYFRPVESANLLFPENQISEDANGEAIDDIYNNYLPALFDPCLLEKQAALSDDPNAELLEHTVEKIGTNTYAWSQHHGGANLDTMYYDVTDGLITRYSKVNGSAIMTEVSYTDFSGDLANYFVTAYGY